MKKAVLLLVGLFFSHGFTEGSASVNDAAVVQAILTKCGISGVQPGDITVVENGRVVSLDLKNRDISKDGLTTIPDEITQLTELRVLGLSGNVIDSIPRSIISLVNLAKLDLGSNRITDLPSFVGELKNLTHLDLRHNRISVIPPEIAQCVKLELLQLWGNKLTVLEDAIVKLPLLQELYLKDNRLATLPAGMAKIKYRYVDIIGNKLCNLDASLDAWAKKVDKRYKETQKCW